MKKYPTRGIVLIALLTALIAFPSLPTVSAATGTIYTVNTAADPGNGVCDMDECTLREAISTANSHLNGDAPDEIHFNIAGGCDAVSGVCTIAPTTALPAITEAVIIDGYTQPGASVNSLDLGDNARLLVEISGDSAPDGTDGFTITGAGSSLRGLVINRFPRNGIAITGSAASKNKVEGVFIGTDASGTRAQPNLGSGVVVEGGSNNYIGGLDLSMRNLISGNGGFGIEVKGSSASYNYISKSFIGTDSIGTASLANLAGGVRINGAQYSYVGRFESDAGNLISGNRLDGVRVTNGALHTYVLQNIIGRDITETASLGNERSGVYIDGAVNTDVGSGNIPYVGNVISGNGAAGVQVLPAGTNSAYANRITLNSIYGNGGLGIDLAGDGVTPNDPGDTDGGPNHLQNFPLISGSDGHLLNWTLQSTPNTMYHMEFFASSACDPSGYGEGQKYLNYGYYNTNVSGQAGSTIPITPIRGMPYITATAAIENPGETSEFSPCYVPAATVLIVNPTAALYGESVTLTATVTTGDLATPYPAGLVQFKDGDTPLGAPVPLDTFGQAAYTTSTLALGTHTLKAEFLGNETYPSSGDSLIFNVNAGYTVTNNSDSLDGICDANCSLADAIYVANKHPNGAKPDEIHFNIVHGCYSDGVCSLSPRIETLPPITEAVIIDGYTQPGASPNTLTVGNNARPLIEINGFRARGYMDGLVITGNGSTVRGLIIKGFHGNGILITGGAAGNRIVGNIIGADESGTGPYGNLEDGIYLDSSPNNIIGGTEPGERNLITGNGGSGVRINGPMATGNTVQGNAIFGNDGLGIDLSGDGITSNDPGDGDTGANLLQNFPLLTAYRNGSLNGTLNSAASTAFRVEVFANSACDPAGYGEGEQFIGAQEVTTGADGNASYALPYTAQAGKPYLTATATNLATGDTSEFSSCFIPTDTVLTVNPTSSIYGKSITLTATVTTGDPAAPTPTGLVQFKDGETPLGAPVALDAAGQAAYSTSALSAGAHTLTAEYLGDGTNPASSATLAFSVSQAATTLALSISADPAILNRPVTLTAVVTAAPPGGGIPSGLVTFMDGETPLHSAALVPDGSGGARATITVVLQTLGQHHLKASFGGDSNFTGSVGEITVETRALLYLPYLANEP